jgi:tetratricopeptide (TPR) repeat protein
LGAAAYKSGDLALAKEAFGRTLSEGDDALSTRAHYNLANTLFRAGEKALKENQHPKVPTIAKDEAAKAMIAEQWQSAREHYEAALAVDSGNRDARHNLGIVEQRLQLLSQPPPPEEEKQDEEEKDENEDENQDQQDQQNQDSPSDSDPQPGDQPPPDQQEQEQNPQGEKPEDQNPQQPKDPSETPAKPEPSDQPPPPDPEGELEGKPNEPKEQETQPQSAQETEVNPETGFSPEEARQMLRALSDEDTDARPPIRMPMQAEKYKNW